MHERFLVHLQLCFVVSFVLRVPGLEEGVMSSGKGWGWMTGTLIWMPSARRANIPSNSVLLLSCYKGWGVVCTGKWLVRCCVYSPPRGGGVEMGGRVHPPHANGPPMPMAPTKQRHEQAFTLSCCGQKASNAPIQERCAQAPCGVASLQSRHTVK